MDGLLDDKFHTHAHTKTNITQPSWEWCVASRISMQPRATISINRAGFDVQALIPREPLSALSHNNLDGYHSTRLIQHGRVFVCVFSSCSSLCLWVCGYVCSCKWVCTWSWDICSFVQSLPDCTMRLEFGKIKGLRLNLVAGRVLSSLLIIVLLNCFLTGGYMCLLYGLKPKCISDKWHCASLLFFIRQIYGVHYSICKQQSFKDSQQNLWPVWSSLTRWF